jgi:hypothetical protein
MTKQGVRDLVGPLVIGCSEQLPNDVRAYRCVGTSSGGGLLLSRHGVTYSAARGDVSDYGQLLERMLAPVLSTMSPALRAKARGGLIRRWNRDWGVEPEDLTETDTKSDRDGVDARGTGSGLAIPPLAAVSSPLASSEARA